MPTPQVPVIDDDATLDELRQAYIGMARYLNYLLTVLDTINISRLDAKVIISESITADKIAAKSITADKMSVNELSAITANLGHINAGIVQGISIIGSTINNGNGTFSVGVNGDVTASSINITGGNITGASNINVTSNVYAGDSMTVKKKFILSESSYGNGISWGQGGAWEIYIDPAGGGMFIESAAGIYANGKRIDV